MGPRSGGTGAGGESWTEGRDARSQLHPEADAVARVCAGVGADGCSGVEVGVEVGVVVEVGVGVAVVVVVVGSLLFQREQSPGT